MIIVSPDLRPPPPACAPEPRKRSCDLLRLVVPTGVGLVLVVAAWLKSAGGPGGVNLILASRSGLPYGWLLVAVVLYELLLAAWLLSRVRWIGATVTAIGTFVGFAALSAHAAWAGRASCGCLGDVAVAPWWTLIFDFGVVSALVLTLRGRNHFAGVAGGVGRFAVCLALAVAGWTAAAALTFDSSDALIAYLRGHQVVPLTSVVDAGPVAAGETGAGAVVLRNTATISVTVVGGSTDCTCTLLENLPLTLPPGGEGRVVVRIQAPAGRGEFSHHGVLWTDAADGRRTIPVAVVGRSIGP